MCGLFCAVWESMRAADVVAVVCVKRGRIGPCNVLPVAAVAVWKLERWPGAAVPSWRAFFVSVGSWRRAAKRGRVRKSAGRVLEVVMSGASATVAGRVAVGSLNADGMPWVMSGREDVWRCSMGRRPRHGYTPGKVTWNKATTRLHAREGNME